VTFVVEQARSGRRSGHRCVKPTSTLIAAGAKPCTRMVSLGGFKRSLKSGRVSVPFTGRIGRHALAVGVYTLVATPVSPGHISGRPRTAGFVIVTP
jgi:hypothetical protein